MTKLQSIRSLMTERNFDAYIIPSEDAHQSEYIADWDSRRAFASNFTGSAGVAVVLQSNDDFTNPKAALWTDGRYFLQAEKQLDTNQWILMKAGEKDTPSKENWIKQNLTTGSRIGIDARLISHSAADKLTSCLKGFQVVFDQEENLVDVVWKSSSTPRPAELYQPIQSLSQEFTGRSTIDKLSNLRKDLASKQHSAMLVTALDDIAWLFNLRGSDIQCNPVFFAFALIPAEEEGQSQLPPVTLYLHFQSLSNEIRTQLEEINVSIADYDQIYKDLSHQAPIHQQLVQLFKDQSLTLLISANYCNRALVQDLLKENCISAAQITPIQLSKAIKNAVEMQGFRDCHIRDGAALVRYFAYLEEALKDPSFVIDEFEGAERLEAFRSENHNFRGLSFDTISGMAANGAIIHYKPEAGNSARITANGLYLCDSGAQYLDGTTDVTRTVHFGNAILASALRQHAKSPTAEEINHFTRVLMGHIDLAMAVFPPGTTGLQLDVLARQHLWMAHLDYRHGTGHGVGHYLNVHEGPHSISYRAGSQEQPLVAGMAVTNEPGYYQDGSHGIRIENVMLVVPHRQNQEFLSFETVTMAPIQTDLVNVNLMQPKHIQWLNDYNAAVCKALTPLLSNDQRALDYLCRQTQPLSQ